MQYRLTPKMYELLKEFEGENKLKIFDSSKEGFVLGFGMTKTKALEKGIIEIVPENPLLKLCDGNVYIPHEWIKKNLTKQEYKDFLDFMVGQAQSDYGVYSCDVRIFLNK